LQAGLELFQDRLTVGLVELQPRLRVQTVGLGLGLEPINRPQALQDMTAFFGKVRGQLHKRTRSVNPASPDNGLERLGLVARESIAHLQRQRQIGLSLAQHVIEILPSRAAGR
jgi:hypothetical protein